jgi:hypothetical protein
MADRLMSLSQAMLSVAERSVLDVVDDRSITRNALHYALPHLDTADIDAAVKQLVEDGALDCSATGLLKRAAK